MTSAASPPSFPLSVSAFEVPAFEPVRPLGGRHRMRRAVRRRRRTLAVSLAVVAAAVFAAAAPRGEGRDDDGGVGGGAAERAGAAVREEPGARRRALVSAPVRIADPGAVRLLKPGDVVNVLAAGPVAGGERPAPARVVARRARVVRIPGGPGAGGRGALLVLAVRPGTAAVLAGAGATAELAVARW